MHHWIKRAIRVINSMPKWKPSKQRGRPVRVKYIIPINFRFSRKTKKKLVNIAHFIGEMGDIFVGYCLTQSSLLVS